jgi:hypothetical protein
MSREPPRTPRLQHRRSTPHVDRVGAPAQVSPGPAGTQLAALDAPCRLRHLIRGRCHERGVRRRRREHGLERRQQRLEHLHRQGARELVRAASGPGTNAMMVPKNRSPIVKTNAAVRFTTRDVRPAAPIVSNRLSPVPVLPPIASVRPSASVTPPGHAASGAALTTPTSSRATSAATSRRHHTFGACAHAPDVRLVRRALGEVQALDAARAGGAALRSARCPPVRTAPPGCRRSCRWPSRTRARARRTGSRGAPTTRGCARRLGFDERLDRRDLRAPVPRPEQPLVGLLAGVGAGLERPRPECRRRVAIEIRDEPQLERMDAREVPKVLQGPADSTGVLLIHSGDPGLREPRAAPWWRRKSPNSSRPASGRTVRKITASRVGDGRAPRRAAPADRRSTLVDGGGRTARRNSRPSSSAKRPR